MGFFEFATVFVLFVILPAVLLNGIKEIKKTKSSRVSGGSNELRASELQAMIQATVEDAVAPLSARVADLEERLGDESVADLRTRLDPAVLADALGADLDPDADLPAAAARRSRA